MYGSESSSDGGWISWFIELEGHEFFVEVSVASAFQRDFLKSVRIELIQFFTQVDVEYIRDAFNLFGIKERVTNHYK